MNLLKFSLHIKKERHGSIFRFSLYLMLPVTKHLPWSLDTAAQPLAGATCSFRGSSRPLPPPARGSPSEAGSSTGQEHQHELKVLSSDPAWLLMLGDTVKVSASASVMWPHQQFHLAVLELLMRIPKKMSGKGCVSMKPMQTMILWASRI